MKKNSIKNIVFSNIIKAFLTAIVFVVILIALSYRNFFEFISENRALSTAEVIKASLTAHMKMGVMDKREYFLNEISSVYDIESIKIIRSELVNRQFGASTTPFEEELTPTTSQILALKEAHFAWRSEDLSLNAIIPYIASSKGALNCLQCHNVNEGDVLGAVRITMNTELYQQFAYKYSYYIAILLLLFALLIMYNMRYVLKKHIELPLLTIINEAEKAYTNKKSIDTNHYAAQELKDVVTNFNTFNQKIVDHEKELYDKNRELQILNNEIELTLRDIIEAMSKLEEIRSQETKNHTDRVSKLSALVATEYGMSEEDIKLIELTAGLHDLGKVGISDNILNKPAKLTNEEYEIMKSHADFGYQLLKHSERKIIKVAASIAHEHHEKYDGTGYPQGLKGEEISIFARVVSAIDVLDALASKRVYKDRWSRDKITAFFQQERAKAFDPKVTDIILKNIDQYLKIIKSMH